MYTTLNSVNVTGFPSVRNYRSISTHEHRKKFIWFIYGAGGILIIIALSLLIYRYISYRKRRNGTSPTIRNRRRPLPSVPHQQRVTESSSSGYISPTGFRINALNTPLIIGEIVQRSDNYLRPVVQGFRINAPNTPLTIGEIVQRSDNYLRPVVQDNQYNSIFTGTGNGTPPVLPTRDYENQVITRHQGLMAPIHIHGNIEQMNLVQGTATMAISGVQFGSNNEK